MFTGPTTKSISFYKPDQPRTRTSSTASPCSTHGIIVRFELSLSTGSVEVLPSHKLPLVRIAASAPRRTKTHIFKRTYATTRGTSVGIGKRVSPRFEWVDRECHRGCSCSCLCQRSMRCECPSVLHLCVKDRHVFFWVSSSSVQRDPRSCVQLEAQRSIEVWRDC